MFRLNFTFFLIALLFPMSSVRDLANGASGQRWLSTNSARNFSSDTDLSDRSWVEAFDALHSKMSREYPFTEWKAIDWASLYSKFRPKIVSAQSRKDDKAYYLALREYVYSIPDGHVRIRGDDPKKMLADLVGGGYGLAVTRLDDSRIIAHIILSNGAADKAGIKFGAQIIRWDGQPIEKAVEKVPLWYDHKPPTTQESRRLIQLRYLVRGPVGHKTKVTFRNPGQSKLKTVTLTATDDDLETLTRTDFYATAEERKVPVQFKILPSGYGYVKITTFPSPQFASVAAQFKEAIQTFVDKKVPAMIIDLRHNGGGDDEVTAQVAGHFFAKKQFYVSYSIFDPDKKIFEPDPQEIVWIEPQAPYYAGKVAAIISNGTVSNGEGLADAIQKLENGHVIGFYGTNGAYGGTGGQVNMPNGYIVLYPNARCVDLDGNILLESDKNGVGGVVPDLRIPRTPETISASFVEGKDVELDFAVGVLSEQRDPKKMY